MSRLMRISKERVTDIVAYLFIFLFLYTAASKLTDIEEFNRVLANTAVITDVAPALAYGIPLIEAFVSAMLIAPRLRQAGLYLSLALMITFTGYLLYMTFLSHERTCSCGGVISTMSWQQHIWFNLAFIVLALIGIRMQRV